MAEGAKLDPSIIKAFQTLLSLYRLDYDKMPYSRAIFTTQPRLWDDEALGEEVSSIIDLSRLLDLSIEKPPGQRRSSESYIISDITEELIYAGWPSKSIRVGYSLPGDRVPNETADIALVDKDSKTLALFEVKRRAKAAAESRETHTKRTRTTRDTVERLKNAARTIRAIEGHDSLWLCISDGAQYLLVDEETHEEFILDHAPSPTELGISSWSLGNSELMRPDSWRSAEEYILSNELDAVLIDFTLPMSSSPSRIEAELVASILPPGSQSIGYIGLREALLAWASDVPWVVAISMIAPNGLAVHSGYYKLTQQIAERRQICSVIDLPPSVSYPVVGISTSLLHFDEFEGNRNLTYFDSVPARSHLVNLESQPWFNSLMRWMKSEEPTTGYVTTPNFRRPLSYSSQRPELNKIHHNLSHLGNATATLGDVCQVFEATKVEGIQEWDFDDGVFVISPSSIKEGVIDFGNAGRVPTNTVPQQALLRQDDLLLLYTFSEEKPVVIFQSDSPAVITQNLLALRINDGVEYITPEYLREYLSSPPVRKLIETSAIGTTSRRIDRRALLELPVPILDAQYLDGFSEIQKAQEKLETKANELRSRARSLFDAQGQSDFQNSFAHLRRASSVTAMSMALSENVNLQIGTMYPFPLAYSYRTLAGLTEHVALYKEQLRTAENLLAFVGSVALGMLHKEDRKQSGIDLQSYWRAGISPGHWREICTRAVSSQKRYVTHPLFREIQKLNIGNQTKGFGKSIQFLIAAKNDFKHDRGPNVAIRDEVEAASQQVQEALDACMVALSFFTDYPLRMVSSMSLTRTGAFKVHCLRYIGDHPGLQIEDITTDFRPLPNDDVFIDLGGDGWLSLYPFISVANCPHCRTREIYFIDRWDVPSSIATLKSFERGHTEESPEIALSLADWGTEDSI